MPNRVEKMDMLRGLAIVGVVAIHTAAGALSDRVTFLGILVNQLVRFAVPAFIFLSGLGLSLSRKPYPGYVRFVWQRIRNLLPAYCLWTVIYLLLPVYFAGGTLSLSGFLQALVAGNASYQLYFVPLIVEFYLLFPLLVRYARKTSGMIIALVLTLAAQTAQTYFTTPAWLHLGDQRNFLNWLFFFVLGIWCAPRISSLEEAFGKKRQGITAMLVLCSAGLLLEAWAKLAAGEGLTNALTQMRPTVLLYSVVFGVWFWLPSKWPSVVKSVLRFLSDTSYEIFLIHVFVLVEFDHFLVRTGIDKGTLTYGVSAFLTALFGSALMVVAWRRVRRAFVNYLRNELFSPVWNSERRWRALVQAT